VRALELAGRIGFVDHVSFALVRLGSNALTRGDTGQAEELCRRALAMAEAAPTSRLAAHARDAGLRCRFAGRPDRPRQHGLLPICCPSLGIWRRLRPNMASDLGWS
jgi:hypothetical protein